MADAFFDPTKGPVYDYSKMKPRPPARYLDTDKVAVHPVVRALANPDGSWPHRYSPSVAIRMVEEGEGHVGRTSERYGRSLQDYGFDKAAEEYFDTSWRPGVWAKRSAGLAALSASKRPAPNPYNPAQPVVNPLTRPFASAQDPRRNSPWSVVGTVAQGLVDAQWPVGLTTRSAHPQSQMFHPFTPVGPEVDDMNPITARRRMRSPYIMTGMMQPPGFVFPQPPAVGEEVGGSKPRVDAEDLLGLRADRAPAVSRETAPPKRIYTQPGRPGRFLDPYHDEMMTKHPLSTLADINTPGFDVLTLRRPVVSVNEAAVDIPRMPPRVSGFQLREQQAADSQAASRLQSRMPGPFTLTGPPPFSDILLQEQQRHDALSRMQRPAWGSDEGGQLPSFLQQSEYSLEPGMRSIMPSLMAVGSGIGPAAMLAMQGSPFSSGQQIPLVTDFDRARRNAFLGVEGEGPQPAPTNRRQNPVDRMTDDAMRQGLTSEQIVDWDQSLAEITQKLDEFRLGFPERAFSHEKAADIRKSMMGLPEFERSYFAQEHPDFAGLKPEHKQLLMADAQRRGTHGDAILNRRPVPSQEEIAQYRSRNPNADMNPIRNRAHLSGGALSPDSPYVTGGQNTPSGLLPGSIDATPSGWYERYQRDQALAQLDANDERLQAPGGHDEFYLNRTRAMLDGSETETDAYKGTLRYADDPMQSRRKTYGMQSERFAGPGNSAGVYGTNRLGALRALNQTGQLEGNTGLQDELRRLEGAAEASAQAKRDSLPARKAAAAERVAAKKNKTLERRNRAALVRAVNAGVLPATALAANPINSSAGSSPSVLSTAAPNTAQNQQDRAAIRSNLVTGVRDDGTPLSPFLHAVSQNRSVDVDDPSSVMGAVHSYMFETATDLGESDVADLWTYMRASTDDSYWSDGKYKDTAKMYANGEAFFDTMRELRNTNNLTSQQKQAFARRFNEGRAAARQRALEDSKKWDSIRTPFPTDF